MLNRILRRLFRRSSKDTIRPITRSLTNDEKLKLRVWMKSPETQLALSVLSAMRPDLYTDYQSPDPHMLAFRDSARLNTLRGWQLCFLQIQSLGLDDKATLSPREDWETALNYDDHT